MECTVIRNMRARLCREKKHNLEIIFFVGNGSASCGVSRRSNRQT